MTQIIFIRLYQTNFSDRLLDLKYRLENCLCCFQVTSYSQATERMKQGASHHGAFKTENPDITASLSDSDSDAGQVKLKPVKAAEQVKPEEIKTEEPDEEEEMASQLENLAKAHSQVNYI